MQMKGDNCVGALSSFGNREPADGYMRAKTRVEADKETGDKLRGREKYEWAN